MPIPKPGKIFQNRYLILEEIGEGGMGLVFHARQLDVDREVALKLLRREKVEDDESVARFYREFKLLNRLCHSNIVRVHALALDNDSYPFAVCEYLEGRTLRSVLLEESPLPWERAVKICIQISEAMQYIHENGIVHRDLKPDNVILQDLPSKDFVKLVDFGLSSEFINSPGAQRVTWTGQLLGSAMYMSPEQVTAKFDQRSDIYALGCLLFEMLSGEVLFSADTSAGVLYRHCNEDPTRRFACIAKKVPASLLKLLSRTLEKAPEHRVQTMKEVGQELRSILADPETLVQGASYTSKARKSRTPIVLVSGCLCVMSAIILAGISFFQRTNHEEPYTNAHRTQATKRQVTTHSLSVLQVMAAACEDRSPGNNSATDMASVKELRDGILLRFKTSKSTFEKERLQMLLPGVLVELARRQFISGQSGLALSTLADAKESMRAGAPLPVRRQYYFLHASLSTDASQIEDDLSHEVDLLESSEENNSALCQVNIFAASRLLDIGRYSKALCFADRAIERARLMPTRENLMIGLAFKITILKHMDSKFSTDRIHKELIQLITAEKGSSFIFDQAQLVYQLKAWETARLLLEDSISCLQKLGKEKMQILPSCVYLLEKVHARLAKSEAALADYDFLLSLYDQYGSLVGVPPRAVITKERSELSSRL